MLVEETERNIIYMKCNEEETEAFGIAYKLLRFREKNARALTLKEVKEFLGRLIDFCRETCPYTGNDTPQFIANLAMLLLKECPKKRMEDAYMTEKEMSRLVQRIIRKEKEGEEE